MTLPKGSVQQGSEKSGIHVGTTDNASNKEIDESCGIASDFIQHERDHYQYATSSNVEEIPAFATQPGSLPPPSPLLFPAQHRFRCIRLRALPLYTVGTAPALPGHTRAALQGQAWLLVMPGLLGIQVLQIHP